MPTTVYKPAGVSVFPPHANPAGDCVLKRLLAEQPSRRDLPWPDGFAGGIAHRLDVSTSGALWVANHPDELTEMRALFGEGRLHKRYRLQVAKEVPWDTNTVERRLAHHKTKRRKMVVERGASTPHRGKWFPAVTQFRRLDGALFEAVIHTGVTHQIRAHAAFVGIPILGDRLYGGGDSPPDAPSGLVFFLHHVGLRGPDGLGTAPVPLPDWAQR